MIVNKCWSGQVGIAMAMAFAYPDAEHAGARKKGSKFPWETCVLENPSLAGPRRAAPSLAGRTGGPHEQARQHVR